MQQNLVAGALSWSTNKFLVAIKWKSLAASKAWLTIKKCAIKIGNNNEKKPKQYKRSAVYYLTTHYLLLYKLYRIYL